MYKAHQDADQLESFVATDWVGVEDDKHIKAVTSSASVKKGIYTVTLTNADLDKKRTVEVRLDGVKKITEAPLSVTIIAADIVICWIITKC